MKIFWAEWHPDAKRDECIRLWKVSLKGATILQMTQQILPKATLTSALRRCHSMELKTHRGPWYYSVLLATISVFFFFLEQSPFPLKPLFVAFEWSKQNTNIWKWKRTSFSRITVGSDRNSVDKMREASLCSSEFQLCCLLNMWELY